MSRWVKLLILKELQWRVTLIRSLRGAVLTTPWKHPQGQVCDMHSGVDGKRANLEVGMLCLRECMHEQKRQPWRDEPALFAVFLP